MSAAEFLSDPEARSAVVTELRLLAELAKQWGNRAWRSGEYKVAAADWVVAAGRSRAADALESGADVDPRDRQHVELAVAKARERMASGLAWAGGVR